MYLFVAAIMFVFTACSGEKTPAQETEEVVVEEVVEESATEDTTATEEPAEESAE